MARVDHGIRRACSGALLCMMLLLASSPHGDNTPVDALTVLSWGGAYERAQQRALFAPFTEVTGIPVEVHQYDGDIAELRRAVAEGKVPWDLIDMTRSQAKSACAEQLLEPLSPDLPAPAPDGTPAERDFIDGALNRCSITHSVFATVVAYRRDAFPGRRPTEIADLFDQQRFPGPRALQRTPAVNLEWALLSYGVPREEIYRLLSTHRGLSLAFERIDSLENLRWWKAGDTPVRLLADNEVVMASGYNGRFFDAMINRDLPIDILWDGQVQEHETWAVPRHAAHPDIARDFIRFATSSERQAALARLIPYGPSRRSATLQVTHHPDSGVDMRLHIPTHPLNAERAITKDDDWYARSHARIDDYFQKALLDERKDSEAR
ncbi:extracellular solute-binding protein [Halomonas caseinilytica]|uniref:Putative spermidine/putrescine transport system substrate-binding protein n=1 Tax=Halomonas caseinilytica TaxID=438744 RepID=A0A1M6TVY6_9GAMM|nr:extracellular solute-binding protein [Halomonas caseinilytica]SHK61101.1 putative spermidine/putrescine transport system substrate-binding protein [Halomonas caseinilytica]